MPQYAPAFYPMATEVQGEEDGYTDNNGEFIAPSGRARQPFDDEPG
jgi:hypothetical protein